MPSEYKNLNGITMSLPARVGLVLTLISLDLPELSTTEIDDTDLSSTIKKSFAGNVKDAGELAATVRFVPGTAIPVGAADETVRVTMPLLTGQTTAGKYEFVGHITKMGRPKAANDGRSEVAITIKCNSDLTWTEGS
jgi:hypothetical protein